MRGWRRGLVLVSFLIGGRTPIVAQAPIAIVGVRLIDGRGGEPIERATVIVQNGKVVTAGVGAKVPAGARVIEGAGLTVIPGLADLHTHLTGGWDGEAVDFLGYRRMVSALLYAGVTTVLDPGDVASWVRQLKDEIDAGRLAGPRVYYTGPVIDGPKPFWPDISASIVNDDQIGHAISVIKQAGATFAKAYVGLTNDQVRRLVDTARASSLRVIADLGQRNGSLGGAETGIAGFAHAGGVPTTDEAVKYMAGHGTMSLTTLVVFESFTNRRFKDLSFLDRPILADILPPSYQAQIRAFAKRPMSAEAKTQEQQATERFEIAKTNIKRMWDGGVLVAAGTDAPYPGDYYGEGLHRELELLVEAGLTPLQAISAATANAARFIGDQTWGTIEPGKVADLLLVRGDPSRRIGDTRNVVQVIQGGRVVDRIRLKFDPKLEADFHPANLRPH